MTALGARIVLTILNREGHEVDFCDYPNQSKKPQRLPLPSYLSFLAPHLLPGELGTTSYFAHFQHLGPSWDECAFDLHNRSPDLVLLSCFAFAYADDAIELVRSFRRLDSVTPVAIGGAGASVYPDYFFVEELIQFVLAGEAEVSLAPFIREIGSRDPDFTMVPNLTWREGNTIRNNPSVLGDSEKIEPALATIRSKKSKMWMSASLTRGCDRTCRFCSIHLCHGRGMRKSRIIRIEEILASWQIEIKELHINFEDDGLFSDMAYAESVIELLLRRFEKLSFTAENGMEPHQLSEKRIRKLWQLGARGLNLSLGSADFTLLQSEKRRPANSILAEATQIASELGLPTTSYFICGLQHESPSSVAANLGFLYSLPTRIAISLFYPVPGLPGFENSSLFKYGASHLCAGSSAFPWTDSLSTRQLITAFRLSRFLNLLKHSENGSPGSAIYKNIISSTLRKKRLHTIVQVSGTKQLVEIPECDIDMVEEVLDSTRLAKA